MCLIICHINCLGFYVGLFALFPVSCFFLCVVILYCKRIVQGVLSVVVVCSLAYETLFMLHSRASQLNCLWSLSLPGLLLISQRHNPVSHSHMSHPSLSFASCLGHPLWCQGLETQRPSLANAGALGTFMPNGVSDE